MVHQTTKGNIAYGAITEAKAVKASGAYRITVETGGDPWYTMMSARKIGELQLR